MSQNISEKILSLLNSKIFCLGDLMLDKYVIGTTNRISPEGPIPVLDIKKEVKMLGGVGNVVRNLCTLAVETHLVSLLGNDTVSKEVEKKLDKIKYNYEDYRNKIDYKYIINKHINNIQENTIVNDEENIYKTISLKFKFINKLIKPKNKQIKYTLLKIQKRDNIKKSIQIRRKWVKFILYFL